MQHVNAADDAKSLPQFSEKKACVLREGIILWRMLYHVLSVGNPLSKSDYVYFGRAIYNKYPCISFPFGGGGEWVSPPRGPSWATS